MTQEIEEILKKVAKGEISIKEALDRLKVLPFIELGFATIDTHRSLRKGFPETIFCQGKTPKQVKEIALNLVKTGENLIATKASKEVFDQIKKVVPKAKYFPESRLILIEQKKKEKVGMVLVISAGTSDIPIAEEAALTAEAMGSKVKRLYDVGVAGVHRLLNYREDIEKARAIVAVAGMEGALPSLIAGLASCPVIGVPTSVGYGTSFQGLASLLAMLNSCAEGLAVVNIDNGFGAGYLASLINLLIEKEKLKARRGKR